MYTYSEQHGETNILPQEQKREKKEKIKCSIYSVILLFIVESI